MGVVEGGANDRVTGCEALGGISGPAPSLSPAAGASRMRRCVQWMALRSQAARVCIPGAHSRR